MASDPATPSARRPMWLLPAVLLTCLGACQSAQDLLDPAPDDPLDGMNTYLDQTGPNSEMDWGDQQELLLTRWKILKQEHVELEAEHRDIQTKLQSKEAELQSEKATAQNERMERVQLEAEKDKLSEQVRKMQATILTLRIRNADINKELLLHHIARIEAAIRQAESNTIEAAGQPASAPIRGGYR